MIHIMHNQLAFDTDIRAAGFYVICINTSMNAAEMLLSTSYIIFADLRQSFPKNKKYDGVSG